MQLKITKEAQAMIQKQQQAGDVLLLDFEDAIGPFTEDAVSCQLYPAYRLLLVSQDFPVEKLVDYNHRMPTEMGPVYMKERSEFLLDKEVELLVEPSYRRLQLRSDAGVLAANVPLKRVGNA
ncbi:iron-sulfur cluster biosynthesis family protein [Enterococcus sp. LJL98]